MEASVALQRSVGVETAQGFARAAPAAGARILEDTAVVGLLVANDRVQGVRTAAGDIHARVVLNAAGLWSARVGAQAGVELPIHVCRHKISIVTWPEAARRPHPMVYDFVTNIYTRPRAGRALLVGGLDAEESQDAAAPGPAGVPSCPLRGGQADPGHLRRLAGVLGRRHPTTAVTV
jgi:glycine/D-amino acid oxidase-like deaminating enzyme